MPSQTTKYPKLLAFIELVYSNLYTELKLCSNKHDLVEAKLISANNPNSFEAIVYSQDNPQNGEKFKIDPTHAHNAPYSWDWRWVFATKIIHEGKTIFAHKFQQKIIALPTGKYPISKYYFNSLDSEFSRVIKTLIADSNTTKESISKIYTSYLNKQLNTNL